MSLKSPEPEIEKANPFKNCALKREKYADALTSIIKAFNDGFVMALNNSWGTGKTTFVKMWKLKLINEGFTTLYFNAWENDFENDALVALLSQLKSLTKSDNTKFKSLVQKAGIFAKKVIPVLVESAANKYVDMEFVKSAIKATTEGAIEIFEKKVNQYAEKEKSLKEFKIELENILKDMSPDKPVVFFIDELDRCRPDYAVEVLEKLKHFFNVKGIVFVLVIDKDHLSKSICGYYGNNEINTDEYLRRFIDIEYSLPDPIFEDFFEHLISSYDIINIIKKYSIDEWVEIHKMLIYLFKGHGLTLRQMEKTMAHLVIMLNTFTHKNYRYPEILIALLYIKLFNSKFFEDIYKSKLTIEELQIQLNELFHNFKNIENVSEMLLDLEIGFVYLYNKHKNLQRYKDLISYSSNNSMNCSIKKLYIIEKDSDQTAKLIQSYSNKYTPINLMNILEVIELQIKLKPDIS